MGVGGVLKHSLYSAYFRDTKLLLFVKIAFRLIILGSGKLIIILAIQDYSGTNIIKTYDTTLLVDSFWLAFLKKITL